MTDRPVLLRVTASIEVDIAVPASSLAVAKRKAVKMVKEAFIQGTITVPDDLTVKATIIRSGL